MRYKLLSYKIINYRKTITRIDIFLMFTIGHKTTQITYLKARSLEETEVAKNKLRWGNISII